MAIVRIPDENRTLTDRVEVGAYLAGIEIDYERWEPGDHVASDAEPAKFSREHWHDEDEVRSSLKAGDSFTFTREWARLQRSRWKRVI